MSGLAGILAGRFDPGIYRWHAAHDVADVRHTVEHVGWRFGAVDGWTHTTKAEVLEAFGEALGFPDTYGHNLDALRDCLGDAPDPIVLLWDGWSTLARADRRTFDVLLRILGEPEKLTVLLRGDGPEIDVPSVD